MANDDLLNVLTRFHREVVLPDIERVVEERIEGRIASFERNMYGHFDNVYSRLDKLDTESVAIKAGLQRLEERIVSVEARVVSLEARIARIEQKLDTLETKVVLRAELEELKQHIHELEERLASLS
ncbi:MAG TPA: hypothetical protein VF618_00850 [Thermoanaerobaculia bacterium]